MELEDFYGETEEDLTGVAPSVITRGRNYHDLRVRMVINKLANNTNMHRGNFIIEDLHISSNTYHIAWILFESESTVH